jgi:hypothetical protein
MSDKLVVIYTPFANNWQSLIEELAGEEVRCTYFSDQKKYFWQGFLKRPNLNTAVEGMRAVLYAKRHKARLLVTIGPRLSFWCGLFCRLFRVSVDHFAFAFNFAELPTGWKKKIFSFGFGQLKSLRVASKMERKLYSCYFGIPEHLIEVRLWGMNVPQVSTDPPVLNQPYVSAVGGNARDYVTLLGAARLLCTIPMVLVVRPENVEGLELPQNVLVLRNIPGPHAMNVVAHSRLMVVPLKDSRVPCGHVTLVAGMLLKKAVVATNSAGVLDYVTDGWNGLLCEPRSATDMAEKIRALWEKPDTARMLGENGFRFASEHCSEKGVREDLSAILRNYSLD